METHDIWQVANRWGPLGISLVLVILAVWKLFWPLFLKQLDLVAKQLEISQARQEKDTVEFVKTIREMAAANERALERQGLLMEKGFGSMDKGFGLISDKLNHGSRPRKR